MGKKQIETISEAQTLAVGRCFGLHVRPGAVITLCGDLGVGKTVFARGVARGLGVTEPVTSPTFTIVQRYDGGRMPLHHFDVYRIGDAEEMDEIGYEDCFYGDGVSIVEWADQIAELIPEDAYFVTIEKDLERGTDYRRITVAHAADPMEWINGQEWRSNENSGD